MGKITLPFIDSDLFKVGLTVYIKLAVQLKKIFLTSYKFCNFDKHNNTNRLVLWTAP
jgi:hypothetical protein